MRKSNLLCPAKLQRDVNHLPRKKYQSLARAELCSCSLERRTGRQYGYMAWKKVLPSYDKRYRQMS